MRPHAVLFGAALIALAGCSRTAAPAWQGYLEGEFVYVSSPLGGTLETLSVQKGSHVEKGAALFALEDASEADAQREAIAKRDSAQAHLSDLQKGSRPTELASMAAKLGQAKAAAELSQLDLDRQKKLFEGQAISASDYDHARLTHEQNLLVVQELNEQLNTANLGGRSDAIQAADADLASAKASLAKSEWDVEQKAQTAPTSAFVYDTLYRQGEYVTAGSPVISLLPPENLKVRFFVADDDFSKLKAGDAILVAVPGHPQPLHATISYLSSQPEYTPPVLYNRDNRSKLVFMVEAVFNPVDTQDLHPGQPVDVSPSRP